MMKILTIILIKLIEGYRYFISPLLGNNCRYLPSCSEYSIEALKNFGLVKGLLLSLKSILSCHPWGRGGFDPISKIIKIKK